MFQDAAPHHAFRVQPAVGAPEAHPGDRVVQAWLFIVAALVVAMVVVGGATRLTDSGLSITEWQPLLGAIPPLTSADWSVAFEKYRQIPEYREINAGMSLAEFQFIYWWEWAHRFLGRVIGLVFALPLAVFWMRGMLRPGLAPKLLGVLALGGLQGFFGWYMVQSGLSERVDVSHYRLALHLTTAFVILALVTWLAFDLRADDDSIVLHTIPTTQVWLAGAILVLFFLQLVFGAFVAGLKAGLTYNTWPLMDGDMVPSGLLSMTPWWMNVTENITAVQFTHRTLAYIVLAAVIWHAVRLWQTADDRRVVGSSVALAAAVGLQAVFGIWTLLAAGAAGEIPIGLGLVHQGGAALVFIVVMWHLANLKRALR